MSTLFLNEVVQHLRLLIVCESELILALILWLHPNNLISQLTILLPPINRLEHMQPWIMLLSFCHDLHLFKTVYLISNHLAKWSYFLLFYVCYILWLEMKILLSLAMVFAFLTDGLYIVVSRNTFYHDYEYLISKYLGWIIVSYWWNPNQFMYFCMTYILDMYVYILMYIDIICRYLT